MQTPPEGPAPRPQQLPSFREAFGEYLKPRPGHLRQPSQKELAVNHMLHDSNPRQRRDPEPPVLTPAMESIQPPARHSPTRRLDSQQSPSNGFIILRPAPGGGGLQVAASSPESFRAALSGFRQLRDDERYETAGSSVEDVNARQHNGGYCCTFPGCDKKYANASNLRRHVRVTHEGKAPSSKPARA